MKKHIEQLIHSALVSLQQSHQLTANIPIIQVDSTKDKQHGDFASNIALVLSREVKCNPRELANLVLQALPSSNFVIKVEIAGPGFINFFLSSDAHYQVVADILANRENYGHTHIGQGKSVLIEFVSSNPTGPLHVGHGRHAAYGAVVADLLKAVGYRVHREYYINDAGRQMDILAVSVWMRYLALCGKEITLPANAYKGAYIVDIAKIVLEKYQHSLLVSVEKLFDNLPLDEPQGGDKEIYIDALIVRSKNLLADYYVTVFNLSLETILKDIHDDLFEFGVCFDEWFSERQFTQSDIIHKMVERLKKDNLIYENEGALWFRATQFNDEKDRVLQRSNGQYTYFANDLAYHVHKFERGFDFAIDIFGSDHHGYVPRMKAGLQAFGIASDKLDYLLVQFVSLYRGGHPVQMSTRSGSFVSLRELRKEVGNDAARFFYVMRKCEQPIDFDLDLAKSQSNENPVYYIQYAHARICSVFKQMKDKNMAYDEVLGLKSLVLLKESQELQLLGVLARYKDVLASAAMQYEPHILTNYLRELANDFHGYYNTHQFLINDHYLSSARLVLIAATRQVLANGLKLLGVSSPDSM